MKRKILFLFLLSFIFITDNAYASSKGMGISYEEFNSTPVPGYEEILMEDNVVIINEFR